MINITYLQQAIMLIMMIALMMMKNNCWQPWPVIRVGDGSLPGLVITGSDNNDDNEDTVDKGDDEKC